MTFKISVLLIESPTNRTVLSVYREIIQLEENPGIYPAILLQLWRDLIEAISILNKRSQDWHVQARNQIRLLQWEATTLEESHLNSLLIAIQPSTYERRTSREYSLHGSSQCMCYMNIHECTLPALGCRPNSTCKVSAKHLRVAKTSGSWMSAYSLSSETDHASGTPLWRDLTKVIFLLN
jgi:hypothetical protein